MSPRAPHRKPLFEVRHSRIHGYGVFALRRIRKGTTVIEYLGDRVTHDLANERYQDKDPKDGHTFLFTVDAKTVIDAGVNGNEARFVNHGCHPNCQTVNTGRRIFIEALRTIQPGEELAYDYQIQRDDDDPADVDVIFACHCGAQSCRGSMLEAPKKKRRPRRPSPKRKVGRQGGRKVGRKGGRKVGRKGGRQAARKGGRQGVRKRPR
jgi:SET domain-containing protein